MSRIDKAIEMAAKIKNSEPTVPESHREESVREPVNFQPVHQLLLKNPFLVTLNEPYGVVAEEYNKLKTIISRLANKETKKNTFLVTSAVPSEGKTLTAANLAISMARSTDYSVVLIDADLRKPSIHHLFGIEEGFGLVQCLRGKIPFESALVKTDLGQLAILQAGQKIDDPLELLLSKDMKHFVESIKEWDPNSCIIFDSPPVLPFADARVLGSLVDNTIFVIRDNFSKKKEVKEGLESLNEANVLGIVCNDTSHAMGNKYGEYYYQRG
ncbi:MAG: polysaccharide biosynthesis tyrosine autokinase [Desulfuromonadales bacterium]